MGHGQEVCRDGPTRRVEAVRVTPDGEEHLLYHILSKRLVGYDPARQRVGDLAVPVGQRLYRARVFLGHERDQLAVLQRPVRPSSSHARKILPIFIRTVPRVGSPSGPWIALAGPGRSAPARPRPSPAQTDDPGRTLAPCEKVEQWAERDNPEQW